MQYKRYIVRIARIDKMRERSMKYVHHCEKLKVIEE